MYWDCPENSDLKICCTKRLKIKLIAIISHFSWSWYSDFDILESLESEFKISYIIF